jgi:hypothetical protein
MSLFRRTDTALPSKITSRWEDAGAAGTAIDFLSRQRSADLYAEMHNSSEATKEEDFEDGMESEFSKHLVSLVQKYGSATVELLIFLIACEYMNAEVAAKTLRCLGRTDHPETYRERLWLLERSLKCSSATVRDAGVLGLASLDDPHAIPYLKRAIKKEKNLELRQHMERVLAQLERLR